jgi:hypothetical protein
VRRRNTWQADLGALRLCAAPIDMSENRWRDYDPYAAGRAAGRWNTSLGSWTVTTLPNKRRSSSQAPGPTHLVVLLHGVAGSPANLAVLARKLQSALGDEALVLTPSCYTLSVRILARLLSLVLGLTPCFCVSARGTASTCVHCACWRS